MQGHLIDGGGPVCLGSNRRLLNEASAGERRYLQQGADAGATRLPWPDASIVFEATSPAPLPLRPAHDRHQAREPAAAGMQGNIGYARPVRRPIITPPRGTDSPCEPERAVSCAAHGTGRHCPCQIGRCTRLRLSHRREMVLEAESNFPPTS